MNPKTLHPTAEAHQMMADLLAPKIKMLLGLNDV
jgi:lysophospholipase L1-like esterase